MTTVGELEVAQPQRAAAWAKAIFALRPIGNPHDGWVHDYVVHEATWYVPLLSKSPSVTQFRYISRAIRFMDRVSDFRRDHVRPREFVERDVKAATAMAEVVHILESLVVCALTKEEHLALRQFDPTDPWDRYRRANIEVYDGVTGARVC